jgi:hypothetical protein
VLMRANTVTGCERIGGISPPVACELRPRHPCGPGPGLTRMRAVQITRFGGPEVLDIAELPTLLPGLASGCTTTRPQG